MKSNWKLVRNELGDYDRRKLLKLIGDLYKLRKENTHFIDARVLRTRLQLAPYMDRIKDALYPDVLRESGQDLVSARRAISDYSRATGDIEGVVWLQLHYVEVGSAFVCEYGGMSDRLCESFTKMFESVVKNIAELQSQHAEQLAQQALKTVEGIDSVGFWYVETLDDLLQEYLAGYIRA